MNSNQNYYKLFLLIQVLKFCSSSGFSDDEKINVFNEVLDKDIGFLDSIGVDENAFIDSDDDEITGKLVANYNHSNSNQNPEELGSYFEGDIRIPVRLYRKQKGGIFTKPLLWANGVVPYEIVGKFSSNELAAIHWAFDQYHKRTCIRFRPRSSSNKERDYIAIVNGRSGCWSAVGRMGGRQEVNLQAPQCLMKRGTAIHELMHVLGFIHEQNRFERDSYVVVRTENIKDDMKVNFVKSSQPSVEYQQHQQHHSATTTTTGRGIGYDYASVMHYSPTSFSKNGKPTIESRKITKESRLMGQRTGFSRVDVAKINFMYNCKNIDVLQGYELESEYVDD
ncbi:zinc metalloproteinase nas-1-like [Eupeodes corollae]|uniref:zinc metalloproteinase nas-1-like n=1 Tax=Eupeodes corollae TaxID=290404 RepID=UPI00248F6518|nr:zinc metalloproteinase nas-1-like [Eupeodes corollae]